MPYRMIDTFSMDVRIENEPQRIPGYPCRKFKFEWCQRVSLVIHRPAKYTDNGILVPEPIDKYWVVSEELTGMRVTPTFYRTQKLALEAAKSIIEERGGEDQILLLVARRLFRQGM